MHIPTSVRSMGLPSLAHWHSVTGLGGRTLETTHDQPRAARSAMKGRPPDPTRSRDRYAGTVYALQLEGTRLSNTMRVGGSQQT